MDNKLPIVSIVGRQNVGKSTLFNAIVKEKKSIVDSHPGLTRDIISYIVNYQSHSFCLSDTPGLDLPSTAELSKPILDNAKNYLEKSSVIILLMENPAPESFDVDLADFIRKLSKPTIIAVNKMDNNRGLENMTNFYEIGLQDILPISAIHNYNINLLLEKVIDFLPVKKGYIPNPDIKISIVGKPNSGKSTLLNSLLGYERSVVSDVPGTTRDSVDEMFNFNKSKIHIIDTAGMRRKRKITENHEYYSLTRTIDSIEKSDVAIHLIDAQQGLTETDKKISDKIIKAKRPLIIAINKWDTIEKDDKTFKEYKDKLAFKLYRTEDFPIISISAKHKLRIHKLIETAIELQKRSQTQITTGQLNKLVSKLQSTSKIPQLGHKLKIYYATQIDTVPPQFKFFVNDATLFRKDVIRYFEKSLQKELDLFGVPIIIYIEGKEKKEKKVKKSSKKKKKG